MPRLKQINIGHIAISERCLRNIYKQLIDKTRRATTNCSAGQWSWPKHCETWYYCGCVCVFARFIIFLLSLYLLSLFNVLLPSFACVWLEIKFIQMAKQLKSNLFLFSYYFYCIQLCLHAMTMCVCALFEIRREGHKLASVFWSDHCREREREKRMQKFCQTNKRKKVIKLTCSKHVLKVFLGWSLWSLMKCIWLIWLENILANNSTDFINILIMFNSICFNLMHDLLDCCYVCA